MHPIHPDFALQVANDRHSERVKAGEARYRVREAEAARTAAPTRPSPVNEHVVLRLDRAEDVIALRDLTGLSEERLPAGPFVVAEIEGRLVAAISISNGARIFDPFVPRSHVAPLLELRAAQIRRAGDWPRPRRRLRPRWA